MERHIFESPEMHKLVNTTENCVFIRQFLLAVTPEHVWYEL